MQVRAVNVSLTAGESARMAIYELIGAEGDVLSVRGGPVMCAPLQTAADRLRDFGRPYGGWIEVAV